MNRPHNTATWGKIFIRIAVVLVVLICIGMAVNNCGGKPIPEPEPCNCPEPPEPDPIKYYDTTGIVDLACLPVTGNPADAFDKIWAQGFIDSQNEIRRLNGDPLIELSCELPPKASSLPDSQDNLGSYLPSGLPFHLLGVAT